MITILARFKVLPDKVAEFEKCAIEVAHQSRKERGNLSYTVLKSKSCDTDFTFMEEWLNDAVIGQHNKSQHFNEFIIGIESLIEGDVKIEQFSKIPSIF